MQTKRIVRLMYSNPNLDEYIVQTLKRKYWLFGKKVWVTDKVERNSGYFRYYKRAVFQTLEEAKGFCGLTSDLKEQKVIIDNIKYNEKTQKGTYG